MSESQMRHDLSRKIADAVGQTLERELRIAAVALPSADVILISTNVAAALGLFCAANAAGNAKPGREEQIFDLVAGAIVEKLGEGKMAALRALLAKRAEMAK